MRTWFTGRRGIYAWTAIGVTVAIVAAITVVTLIPRDRTTEAQWADSTLSVTALGTDITVGEATVEPEAATAFATAVPSTYLALRPLEISAEGEIPESGVTLSLALAEPLPAAAAATFVYYDEEIATWVPEYTTVSEDRLTLTAVVHHLSAWSVFTSAVDDAAAAFGEFVEDVAAGVGESIDRGSRQLFRFTHELVGNSADNPECTGTAPWWVQDTILSDNNDVDLGLGEGGEGTNAVLLCVGSSADDPEILELKAAANRGYGFPITMSEGVRPLTAGPSSLDPNVRSFLQFASSYLSDLGGTNVFAPDQFVFATQEYTATFDEQTLRQAGVGRLLSFDLPGLDQVLLSAGLKWALDKFEGNDVVAGIMTVLSMVRDCEMGELNASRTPTETIAWLTACASSLDYQSIGEAMDVVATEVAYDDEALAAAMKDKAQVVRKATDMFKGVLIITIAQTLIDYAGDSLTENVTSYPAWFVQVTLTPERPTLQDMYGTYTQDSGNGFFTTMKVDDEGVDIRDCSGCGSVSVSLRLVNPAWNGSCYEVLNQVEFDGGDGTRDLIHETWTLCPKGFGGPGNDSVDRIGQNWQGKAPDIWYLRD
ncbi:hypothetical protein [Microbacterium caowuchunii]|uniref:Uncharacterized protein n=1 Tax=Microbacterium caowuchunii TaxID=2614638 RepID=A0A5N0TIT4_9MICO|nr:hypothetical protein [Microbacterium caowuchunii]KAA9134511.1 hypothetical protein F6B40_07055 [Microbacterium caowuchunii]